MTDAEKLVDLQKRLEALEEKIGSLVTRVVTAEGTLKNILTGITHAEKETGVAFMPEGEYYGVSF